MNTVTLIGGPLDGRTHTITPFNVDIVSVEAASDGIEIHHTYAPMGSNTAWDYLGKRTHDAGASRSGCAGSACRCSRKRSALALMIDLGHTAEPTRRDDSGTVTHWRCTACDRTGYESVSPGGVATLHPCKRQ